MRHPRYGSIDWEMADFNHPPENVFRDKFMIHGIWDRYNEEVGKVGSISFEHSIRIAKDLWREFCHAIAPEDPTIIEIHDENVVMCEAVETPEEPMVSLMVNSPGEVLLSREELLYMIDALNSEW